MDDYPDSKSWRHHFGEYVEKCGWKTSAIIFGGGAVTSTIGWIINKAAVPVAFGLGSAATTFFATFHVWRHERLDKIKRVNLEMDARKAAERVIEEQRIQIRDITRERDRLMGPALDGKIEGCISWDTNRTDNPQIKTTGVLLMVAIANSGSPTIVENYKLEIHYDGKTISGIQCALSPELRLKMPNGSPIAFDPKEALYEKTTVPISSGNKVRGWLLFMFDGVMREESYGRPEAFLRLAFEDVKSTIYSVLLHKSSPDSDYSSSEIPDLYVPGTSNPFAKFNPHTPAPLRGVKSTFGVNQNWVIIPPSSPQDRDKAGQ